MGRLGSRNAGLAAAVDEPSREAALNLYESRVHATTAIGPRASLWETWSIFHRRWFGSGPDAPPILPLTPESIQAVMAMFITGGDRSAANYLSRAKDEHTKFYEWTSPLAREQRRANAAARRGLGPARQSAMLPLDSICRLTLGTQPASSGRPVGFQEYCIVASMFLLREIEASLMLASSVAIDTHKQIVTIHLPVSKTDPRALACFRAWGCICDGQGCAPCAYHAAVRQHDRLLKLFGVEGVLPAELPFFPTGDGSVADKQAVVDSVEQVAVMLGLPLRGADGRPAFGGHDMCSGRPGPGISRLSASISR